MATRLLPPGYQVFDANGNVVSGALLYTYEAGTSTAKPSFSDAGGTIANANPTVADASGRFGNLFATTGDYRLVMQTAAGATLFTADPVSGDTSLATVPGSGFRNMLINGDFSVDQRQATSVADDTYCLDGWYGLTNTGNITIAQQTLQADGIPTNIRLLQPDVGAKRMGIAQIVEASNCREYRNAAVTLSAKIRNSLAAPVRYAILSWTGTADAVTSDVVLDWTSSSYTAGGFFLAANLTVQSVGSITPAAATWTDVTAITSTLSGSLNNLVVFFWTEGTQAQNSTLSVANVQVEQGSVATSYEYLPRSSQLQRCYPYFRKSFLYGTAPAQAVGSTSYTSRTTQAVAAATAQGGWTVDIGQPMRTSSYSITLYNPISANAKAYDVTLAADVSSTGANVGGESKINLFFTSIAGSAVGDAIAIHWTLDASL
jgi:hypothetical protein